MQSHNLLMETRQNFLHYAQNHQIVNQVIEGTTTLSEHLDSLLDSIESESSVVFGGNVCSVQSLVDYASLLGELSDQTLPVSNLENDALELAQHKLYKSISGMTVTVMGLGALLLCLPPFNILELGVLGLGYLANKATKRNRERSDHVKKYRFAYFSTLSRLARTLDKHLCESFIYDDLTQNPARFEQTYCALEEAEQDEVDARLHRLLEAGAFEMDEQDIDAYLADLRENGPSRTEEGGGGEAEPLKQGYADIYESDPMHLWYRGNPWAPRWP